MIKVIYHGGQKHGTLAILSEPTTLTYTFEQSASVHRETCPGERVVTDLDEDSPTVFVGLNQKCKFDTDKKEGVCVDECVIPLPVPITTVGGTKTLYSTFTGTRSTIYTGALLPFETLQVNTPNSGSRISASKGANVEAIKVVVGAITLLL